MNWLDITLVCLIGIALVKGLFDGVVKQVVSLIAVVIALMFTGKVAAWLQPHLEQLGWFHDTTLTVASYALGFAGILLGCMLIAVLLHKLIDFTPLGILNHLFGGVLGAAVMVLLLSVCLNLWDLVDPGAVVLSEQTRKESRFYSGVKAVVPTLFPTFDFRRYLPGTAPSVPAPVRPQAPSQGRGPIEV